MKPTRLLQATHEIVTYAHSPEYGVDLDTVMKPEYWSHVAQLLRPGYVVVVTAADMSWRAELMVRAAGRNEALMGLVSHVEFGEVEEPMPEGLPFEVKWRGPARKFGVIRKVDSEVLRDEFVTKEAASQWLRNHMKAVAA